jgi:hypothetical protein
MSARSKRPAVEVDVLPTQPENLSEAHPRSCQQYERHREAFRRQRSEERVQVLGRPRPLLCSRHCHCARCGRRVAADKTKPFRVGQRTAQHDVTVADSLRRQGTAARSAVRERRSVQRLDLQWRRCLQQDRADLSTDSVHGHLIAHPGRLADARSDPSRATLSGTSTRRPDFERRPSLCPRRWRQPSTRGPPPSSSQNQTGVPTGGGPSLDRGRGRRRTTTPILALHGAFGHVRQRRRAVSQSCDADVTRAASRPLPGSLPGHRTPAHSACPGRDSNPYLLAERGV